MVEVGTAKSGEKEIKTKWPIEEGLTAGTSKLPKKPHLVAEIDLTDPKGRVGL